MIPLGRDCGCAQAAGGASAAARAPLYSVDVVVALAYCCAGLGAPTGKRLAPVNGGAGAPLLRRFGELKISDNTELALIRDVAGDDGPPTRP